jgi:hypothetical protein
MIPFGRGVKSAPRTREVVPQRRIAPDPALSGREPLIRDAIAEAAIITILLTHVHAETRETE